MRLWRVIMTRKLYIAGRWKSSYRFYESLSQIEKFNPYELRLNLIFKTHLYKFLSCWKNISRDIVFWVSQVCLKLYKKEFRVLMKHYDFMKINCLELSNFCVDLWQCMKHGSIMRSMGQSGVNRENRKR